VRTEEVRTDIRTTSVQVKMDDLISRWNLQLYHQTVANNFEESMRPIANKYREGKVKSTLKRESKRPQNR